MARHRSANNIQSLANVTKDDSNISNGECTAEVQTHTETSGDQVRFRRKIGLLHAVTLLIGNVIGIGIFVSPVAVLRYSNSVGLALVIWAVSGLLQLLEALVFLEIVCIVQRQGELYD